MRPCTDADWEGFYEFNAAQKSQITAHKAANQFWCPELSDLSVYNTFDSIDHKLVNVYLTTCLTNENPSCVGDTKRQSYFSGKMVMLLTNTQRIDFS